VKYVISDQVVLSRPPKGPLVPYVAAFSTWVAGHLVRPAGSRIHPDAGSNRLALVGDHGR
jgi:hypothetical protein